MLNRKILMGILVCMLPLSGLNAQSVVRTVRDYVLLDTDQNIGKIGDRLHLYRISEGKAALVGTVEIVTFRDGRTAARVVSLERGMTINTGDFVPDMDSRRLSALRAEKDHAAYRSEAASAKFAGIFLGGWAPSPELDQTLNPAFCLGLRIKMIQLGSRTAFYANAVFPFSSYKYEDAEVKMNFTGFHLLANFRLSPSVFLDIGPGFHMASIKSEALDEEEGDLIDISDTKSYAGFTAGISMLFAITDRIALAPEVNVSAFHRNDDWQTYARMGLSVHFDVW